MGKPIKILDLAEKIIRLNGLTPIYSDDKNHSKEGIQIQFTGLRPGEKMYEELLISGSEIKTENKKIFKANESFISQKDLSPILEKMQNCIKIYDNEGIIKILSSYVEGFTR